MPAARTTAQFVLLVLSVVMAHVAMAHLATARAETPDADAVQSSVAQIFSMATMGAVTLREQDAIVTRQGVDYLVRLPLSGFTAPPDAAVTAVARRSEHGTLEITSMTFPAAGTIELMMGGLMPGAPPGQLAYTIEEQRITAKADPAPAMPSSYQATFGHVRMLTDNAGQHAEQTIDRYAVNGSMSGDPDGRVSLTSQGSGTGFRLAGHGPGDFASDATVRAIAGHLVVDGLDRAQGAELMAAFRDTARHAGVPDQGADDAADGRQALRRMIGAATSLMRRLEAEEVLEDVRFAFGAGANAGGGTIGRMRVNMSGEAREERLNTQFGITVDGIAATALSADNAAFVPHHVEMRTVLGGLQTAPLLALLRATSDSAADLTGLRDQAIALLADPQVRIAIENLAFDSGPLQIRASARVVAGPGGQPAAEVHIAATGVDMLLAQAPTQPNLQSAMPMIFMAKGMGRPEGESLVWDIRMGDGPMTVNGTPLGQLGGSHGGPAGRPSDTPLGGTPPGTRRR